MSNLPVEDPSFLGEMTTPGAAADAHAVATLDDTVRVIGPLPAGKYTLEASAEASILQGNKPTLTDGADPLATPIAPNGAMTAVKLRARGLRAPANTEIVFYVRPQYDFVAFTKMVAGGAGGTLRVNFRGSGKTDGSWA
jgi:hypothetical protein